MSLFEGLKQRFAHFKGVEWIVLLVFLGILGSVLLTDGTVWMGGDTPTQGSDLEARLATILSSIEGAGRVQVMVYDDASARQSDSLFQSTTASSTAKPVGVVIVADGAGDIRVRLELVRAVQTLMDLPAEAVEVFRMTPQTAR